MFAQKVYSNVRPRRTASLLRGSVTGIKTVKMGLTRKIVKVCLFILIHFPICHCLLRWSDCMVNNVLLSCVLGMICNISQGELFVS